jgi:hypothetical protein
MRPECDTGKTAMKPAFERAAKTILDTNGPRNRDLNKFWAKYPISLGSRPPLRTLMPIFDRIWNRRGERS